MPKVNLNHPVLVVDDNTVTLGEVMASARLGGWLNSDLEQLRTKLACTALAEEDELQLDIDILQTRIDSWRRERDLSAVDETEAMLQTYRTSLDDLVDYTKRTLLYEHYREQYEEACQRFPQSAVNTERLLPLEVIFNQPPVRLLDDFSLRVVAEQSSAELSKLERARLLKGTGLPRDHWPALLLDAYGIPMERSEWLLNKEVAFRLQRQMLVNEETVFLEFEQNALALVRLEVTSVEVADKDVAKELLCCIREDHESLPEAAAHADLNSRSDTWFFSDLDALPFGTHLPAARPGDAFGPASLGNHYLVLQLGARHEAELADAATRARLEKRLIERALRKKAAQRVQFIHSAPLR